MIRYFIEVSYKGTLFSGFQSQDNGLTIQTEINRALSILLHKTVSSTTASRTDAGVHASQNFLHFDAEKELHSHILYQLNAMLHKDIVVKNIFQVPLSSHSRFDASSREYDYFIIQEKNPFLVETSHFYPLPLDIEKMNEASKKLLLTSNFSSFAKRHSEVNNFNCQLKAANWTVNDQQQIIFHVESNRFLRGMVRALVGTQLLVGRNKIGFDQFEEIIQAKDCTRADFSAPAKGLFLSKVNYPDTLMMNSIMNEK